VSCHVVSPSPLSSKKIARFDDETRRIDLLVPHLSVSAGIGTLHRRLPWFHRAVPSATLDKGFLVLVVDFILTGFFRLSICSFTLLSKIWHIIPSFTN
jgi:hypothetical protein